MEVFAYILLALATSWLWGPVLIYLLLGIWGVIHAIWTLIAISTSE